MSDLDESTETQLLRILVDQTTKNSTTEIPPSKPPSSALTVSSLWFLSIMSSLAATTWAILCLEWCAFFTDSVQAGDYKEMAEKRQQKFEAVKRWKMHLVVAAIPLFLHISLFLFLAGLWLRLRDVNKQLGLIVGVSSLIILSSYVVVTLFPIFTDAPFSTSASELAQPVFNGIGSIVELRHLIHPPPIFPRVARLLPAGFRRCSYLLRLGIHPLIVFPKRVYRTLRQSVHSLWKSIVPLPITPRFGPDRDPFNELNKLEVGRPVQDDGTHLRALFWLVSTPLSKDEVKGVLKELGVPEYRNRGVAGKPLDPPTIRLLILSLSSFLEGDRVSEDEQLIFDHCTTVLAAEVDRAFGDEESNQRTILRNTAGSERLSHYFHTISDGHTFCGEDYWARAVPALWLCPSTKTIRSVIDRLNLDVRWIEKHKLQDIVRGLHAAILACFTPTQPTYALIPDFDLWSWDSSSFDRGLDNALLGFLRSIFVTFYATLPRCHRPITTPALIIDCLKVLDEQPERYTPNLYSALCFFVVVMQRSNLKVFEEGPSATRTLLASAESYKGHSGGNDSKRMKVLAAWLRAIAYGSKPLISWESHYLKSIGDLYAGLPDSVRANQQCLEGFLDASAATLEATLASDGHFVIFFWRRSPDFQSTRNIFIDSLFTHKTTLDFVHQHPNSRLPYLYSLTIALLYATEGRNHGLWRVADLFVTRDGREGITTDRALDINILVVTVLRFALYDRSEVVVQERKEVFLNLLPNIIVDGTDWRTRWKSIYLIADLARLLSRIQHERDGEIKFLIDAASNSWEKGGFGRVPSDWEKKKKGLALCKLETKVRGLVRAQGEAEEGVYEWRGRENIPYLSMYNQQRIPVKPISNAARWVLARFQR